MTASDDPTAPTAAGDTASPSLPVPPGQAGEGPSSPLPNPFERWLVRLVVGAALALLVVLVPVSLYRLTWDTPGEMSYDGALYTDEGLYAHDAILWYLEGAWHKPREYNQYIAVPLLPYMQAGAFVLFGANLTTVRVLNWLFAVAWLAGMLLLYRRFLGWRWAVVGVALVASNHVVFAMSRFALAEMPAAMFATWAVVAALESRGRATWPMAVLCSLAMAGAALTKVNALFLAPLVAAIMIANDPRWRPVLAKLAVCSAVFAVPVGLHAWVSVLPHLEEFNYFFSLNVAHRSSMRPLVLATGIWGVYRELQAADPILMPVVLAAPALALLMVRRHRRAPMVAVLVVWYALFTLLYAYYGRLYLRFFPIALVATHGLLLWAMWAWWQSRRSWSAVPLVLGAVLVAAATVGNLRAIHLYVFKAENTFNDMAADIARQLEADPRGNRVVMGHHAGSLALRVPGLVPRHDRYGMVPAERRLLLYRPGWYTCEIPMRFHKFHAWYQHHEWIERLFDVELRGTYYILRKRTTGEVYRGYPVVFYRLEPREEAHRVLASQPEPTRPAVP